MKMAGTSIAPFKFGLLFLLLSTRTIHHHSAEALVTSSSRHTLQRTFINTRTTRTTTPLSVSTPTSGKGFAPTVDEQQQQQQQKPTSSSSTPDKITSSPINVTTISGDANRTLANELSSIPLEGLKTRLLDLLPRMTGKREELEEIAALVDVMEAKFSPVVTLDFLNLAMQGEWQLLFSTNRLGRPSNKLRLRELVQRVEPNDEPNGNSGIIDTLTTWDLAEDGINFSHTGSFTIKGTYEISSYPRLSLSLAEHVLKPRGDIPNDVQGLFGMLYHAVPQEMFDPSGLALDTTFLDVDVRIVRLSGDKFEGVRNIFIRRGAVEINPVGDSEQ